MLKKTIVKILDTLMYFDFFIVLAIILSGGFSFQISGYLIKAYNTKNLFFIFLLLLMARKVINIKEDIKDIPAIKLLIYFVNIISAFLNKPSVSNRIIFLIIALAFLLRVNNIHSPLIGHHSWRQADTAAMARNYYENGYKFLYPQIDWVGDSAGYAETEFPIIPFLAALAYKVLGVSESFGRFLSVISSLIATYFLYLLVKKHIDENTALWSSLFFAILPLNVFFGRSFQVESALIMSSILGVYFFSQWLTTEKFKYFIGSLIFTALASLLKIPALYLGLPLLYLAYLKFGRKFVIDYRLWIYAIFVLIPVGLWYYHAHQIGIQYGNSFGIWEYGSDKWGNWGLVFSLKFWGRFFFERPVEWLTYFGYLIFLVGLFIKRQSPQERLFDFWLLALLVYLIIVARGNYVHDYYQMPFIIPFVVFMGKVYARRFTSNREDNKNSFVLTFCLFSIFILGMGQYNSLAKREYKTSRDFEQVRLAETIKQKTEGNDLLIVVDNGDPTILYLAHRKGWHAFPDQIDESFLKSMQQRNAKYIAGQHSKFKSESSQRNSTKLLSDYPVIFNDEQAFIVKIAN